MIALPDDEQLAVLHEARLRRHALRRHDPADAGGRARLIRRSRRKVGAPSPIKHVFYIIRENRTYDQIFGDIDAGQRRSRR